MVMHDPVLHDFIAYLSEKKTEQEANPDVHVRIELSRDLIRQVRDSFRQSILDGERHLHLLSQLLSSVLLGKDFELHSNVIGVLPGEEQRPFLIRERLNKETLFALTDIDLGNHMLDNFRYQQNGLWVPLSLSANFVEYIPLQRPFTGVNRLTSRVKAEEELCNKLTDEIFGLDELLTRDKQLRRYSKFVKDVFGLKIVCESDQTCLEVHRQLVERKVDAEVVSMLEEMFGGRLDPAPAEGETDLLEFVETKDYLTCEPSKRKKTGWRAIKSVVRWQGRLFEIQLQPLVNYYLELDHMSGPSHRSFKISRDSLRDRIAEVIPLYGFYRDLLKMLFIETKLSFEYEKASVVIR